MARIVGGILDVMAGSQITSELKIATEALWQV
jgi:hypothetical protein